MQKLVLTVPEASKALNIGTTKMYELVRKEKIPHLRAGNKILIPKSELKKWIIDSTIK
jgi:excisionase family DNA binding protein